MKGVISMKKKYEKPYFEVTEFCFSEHIASGRPTCYIRYTDYDQTPPVGCDKEIEYETGCHLPNA